MSGPFGSSQWMYSSGADFYSHKINQSLRFEDGDAASMSRTNSSAGNRRTWTFSAWLKLSNLGSSTINYVFGATTDNYSLNWSLLYFGSDLLTFQSYTSSEVYRLQLTQVFRDPSAWYHIVLAWDTTQSTDSNRIKLYVNGEQVTAFNAANYPSLNYEEGYINNNIQQDVGRASAAAYGYDGYMAEVNFIDGTALTPTSFGETKAGIWIPKKYTGSHGTNGYHLDFADGSALGDDESGNNNDFTPTGLAATDVVLDSPTNNWATMNPLNADGGTTGKEGNLELSTANKGNNASTFFMESGKWYWEAIGTGYVGGVCAFDRGAYNNTMSISGSDSIGYYTNGYVYWGTGNNSTPATYTSTDIIGVAVNMDDGEISFYKNNSLQVTLAFSSTISRLATEGCYAAYNNGSTSTTKQFNVNFGQDSSFAGNKTAQGNTDDNGNGDFYYSPPSGFLALCAANLPNPGIDPAQDEEPADYFNTILYTGDGSSSRSLTGVGFKPDWVWTKERSSTSFHEVNDVVRGANKQLFPNATDAEETATNKLTSFDSDGFTVGNSGSINQSSQTYVAWNWLAGGSAVSNSDGSITSSVSANTKAGFSIVSYTGNGSAGATVGHGLASAPEFFITKRRSQSDPWQTYVASLGATKRLELDATSAAITSTASFNDTEPNSSVFTLGSGGYGNASSATYIAYCFHSVDGYSKIGTYSANNSSSGPFVFLGFRPAFLWIKATNRTSHWIMQDNKRPGYNQTSIALFSNLNNSESTDRHVDFLSNGFKLRLTALDPNTNGADYIYIAFAEQPQKFSNAR